MLVEDRGSAPHCRYCPEDRWDARPGPRRQLLVPDRGIGTSAAGLHYSGPAAVRRTMDRSLALPLAAWPEVPSSDKSCARLYRSITSLSFACCSGVSFSKHLRSRSDKNSQRSSSSWPAIRNSFSLALYAYLPMLRKEASSYSRRDGVSAIHRFFSRRLLVPQDSSRGNLLRWRYRFHCPKFCLACSAEAIWAARRSPLGSWNFSHFSITS